MSRRPFVVCVTGSIGAGKSTTAELFAKRGVPVWDADAAVGRLYSPGGAGVAAVRRICPDAVSKSEGAIDRTILRKLVKESPALLAELESAVHPLVREDRKAFLRAAERRGADIAVVEIPLLFETDGGAGGAAADAVVAVSAPAAVRRDRVLARGSADEAEFDALDARQLPDQVKRDRADYVIEATSLEAASRAVDSILSDIRKGKTRNA